MALWVRSLDLTTQTSLSPIRRAFAPSFVNYKNGALDSQPQVIKLTSCLPMVSGSLRVVESGIIKHQKSIIKTNPLRIELQYFIFGWTGPSWMWSYDSRIYNYLCNQCLSQRCCEFESRSGRGVQHYVIKLFVSDLLQVGGFLRVLFKMLLKVALNTINNKLYFRTNEVKENIKGDGQFLLMSIII